MLAFTDLPREVVQHIIYSASPQDLEPLVLTCKTFHDLSTLALQGHHAWRLDLYKFANGHAKDESFVRSGPKLHNLTKLLLMVLADTRIGMYIDQLTLWRWYWPPSPNTHFTAAESELLASAIRTSNLVSDEQEVEIWMKAVRNGYEDPVITLLLLHLPRLQSLNIEDENPPQTNIFPSKLQTMLNWGERGPLRRLTSLKYHTLFFTLDMLTAFMRRPSLTSIETKTFTLDRGKDGTHWPGHPFQSHVTRLDLTCCNIDETPFAELLHVIGRSSFPLTPRPRERPHRHPWEQGAVFIPDVSPIAPTIWEMADADVNRPTGNPGGFEVLHSPGSNFILMISNPTDGRYSPMGRRLGLSMKKLVMDSETFATLRRNPAKVRESLVGVVEAEPVAAERLFEYRPIGGTAKAIMFIRQP